MFFNAHAILSITLLCSFFVSFAYGAEQANLNDEPNPIGHLLSVTTPDSEPQRLHYLIRYLHHINPEHINAQRLNYKGYTPLHTALLREHEKNTIQLLLSLGADTKKVNNHGLTPLEFACTLKPIPLAINPLIEHEAANPLVVEKNKQKKGSNPLHYLMNYTKCVTETDIAEACVLIRAFEQCGYSVNAQDEAGNTPLHYARALKHDEKIARTLLDLGAHNLVQNLSGHAAVEYAYPFTIKTSKFSENS